MISFFLKDNFPLFFIIAIGVKRRVNSIKKKLAKNSGEECSMAILPSDEVMLYIKATPIIIIEPFSFNIALIGPRTVLTAAHCLWNRSTGAFMPPEFLHFVAGYQKGKYIAYSTAVGVRVSPDFVYRGPKGPISRSINDWAIVELKDDIGTITGFLGLARPDKTMFANDSSRARANHTIVGQAGYSRDRQHVLSAHLNCTLLGYLNGKDILAHGCDAISGDSGSPLFIYRNGGFRIIGIHVSTTDGKENVVGAAVPASRFIGEMSPAVSRKGKPPEKSVRAPIVTVIQLLVRLGFDPESGLEGAVKEFQKSKGLPVTGKLSNRLVGLLMEALK